MTEHWNTLLVVDPLDTVIAMGQFKRALSAEERLMLAVLENAVEHFREYAFARDPKGRQLFEEARDWITETGSDWFFSFENICETLKICPNYLRRGLLRWKDGRSRSAGVARNPDFLPVAMGSGALRDPGKRRTG